LLDLVDIFRRFYFLLGVSISPTNGWGFFYSASFFKSFGLGGKGFQ
jgi:hypothetical protein